MINYETYLQGLLVQKAELKAAFECAGGITISVEQYELLTMLGCVELQITFTKARILTNNKIEFDSD